MRQVALSPQYLFRQQAGACFIAAKRGFLASLTLRDQRRDSSLNRLRTFIKKVIVAVALRSVERCLTYQVRFK
jgi:hypothetical protein